MNIRRNCKLNKVIVCNPIDNRFELEKQLHEQYAINNNAILGSVVTIITTLIGVIGIYGYVFIYSTIDFASDWGSFVNNGKYTLDVLLFSAIASYLILVIIFYLSAYIGTYQRKEQFITYAIRKKYYKKNGGNNDYDQIFPSNYHPFNKTKSGFEFIQGLYGEICCILKILFWVITILTLLKIGANILKNFENGVVSCSALVVVGLFIVSLKLSLVSFCCIIDNLYQDYKKRESEFFEKFKKFGLDLPQIKEKSKSVCCISKFLCCCKYFICCISKFLCCKCFKTLMSDKNRN